MSSFRKIIKSILPLELIEIYRLKKKKSKFRGKDIKESFNSIAEDNFWSSEESVSGPGSELQHTETLISELKKYFPSSKSKLHQSGVPLTSNEPPKRKYLCSPFFAKTETV